MEIKSSAESVLPVVPVIPVLVKYWYLFQYRNTANGNYDSIRDNYGL